MSTTTQLRRRPNVASRRAGYTVAAGVNVVLLYLLNGAPGWEAVPFLTGDTTRVLLLVNLSMAAAVATNMARVLYDPRWFVALGDIVSTGIGVAALVRIWQVFPFDFSAYAVGWALVTRVVLGFALAGSIIGIVAQVAILLSAAAGGNRGDGRVR
ncbi:hypothetical protein [Spirilliplanes yamanashiensis]|uniref:Uncharacterized protein n=1 Tax=Spirilliplanes yamanashiensis TaxID=42233 RepID=A0A8J4DN05_9ACTN|nr:hypothetical protein [Spirilliplanes yamanashiensis]MDP9818238.1 hypothetical protein [Spirilliplanes yamanashiensis]GIJ06734.1 hypothetical protein Sya03_60860 [Spirilliplanes yamanashiensis]